MTTMGSPADLTVERVEAAFAALASGDRDQIRRYWAEDLRFEIPGHHSHAGWYGSLDEFLEFLGVIGRLSGGSYRAENLVVTVNAEAGYSVDVNTNWATRAGSDGGSGSPYDVLDVTAAHVLRWHDGRVVEGRGALLGDGAATSMLWWSSVDRDGSRRAS